MEPDHFYLATFKEVDMSNVLSLEPEYELVYDIRSGPYRTVQDAWDNGVLPNDECKPVVVLGFKGCDVIYAYFEPQSDEPTEDWFYKENAKEALTAKVSGW